ncbi:MAG: class I mannose-6-phosphate isomerase [Clostridiales bacterium]|nr:class I mannose-6-phosphate isomerase [Clostridiales bacterium]
MLYPLKFHPVYKSILWGGRNIEKKFNRNIPDGKIAESWELCCRNDGMSIVSNGDLKGLTFEGMLEKYKEQLVGTDVYGVYKNFLPLFIKIIDANDRLSVQVHPDDKYAKSHGEGNGKTEMWYIIDAKPGAKLVYGLKIGVTKSDFIHSLSSGNLDKLLNEIPVSPGDVFYIPSGTVHAILDGILIAEIQQNSNTTYRVFDWNRVDKNGKPRELHIDKAIEVINFDNPPVLNRNRNYVDKGGYNERVLSENDYFTVKELNISDEFTGETDGRKFTVYMFIEGNGRIYYEKGCEPVSLGETVMLPASMGKYSIKGHAKILEIYVNTK